MPVLNCIQLIKYGIYQNHFNCHHVVNVALFQGHWCHLHSTTKLYLKEMVHMINMPAPLVLIHPGEYKKRQKTLDPYQFLRYGNFLHPKHMCEIPRYMPDNEKIQKKVRHASFLQF